MKNALSRIQEGSARHWCPPACTALTETRVRAQAPDERFALFLRSKRADLSSVCETYSIYITSSGIRGILR